MVADTGSELVDALFHLQVREDRLIKELNLLQENRRQLLRGLGDISPSDAPQLKTIDALPPEVLLVIFGAACAFDHGDWEPHQLREYARTPITISHVCRLWRSLALGNTSLWMFLYFGHAPLLDIFHGRSVHQKLDVVRSAVPSDVFGSQDVAAGHIVSTFDRWRSLFWQFSSFDELSWFILLLFAQAPSNHLKRLELNYEHRDMKSPRRGHSNTVKLITPRRAELQFPNLEELHLRNIHLTEIPNNLCSKTLRVLCIGSSNSAAYVSCGFSLSRLCAVLREATGLQELVLENCVPRWDRCLITDLGTSRAPVAVDGELSRMHPLRMSSLRRLGWSLAPPKCVNHLLFALGCNNLEELYLGLDLHIVKMPTIVSPVQWSTKPPLQPFDLPLLRILDVSSRDAYGLTYAVKKLAIPALESFVFSRFGNKSPLVRTDQEERKRQGCTWSPINMPPLESIFHEPRLVNLTQLEFSGCAIKKENVHSMLVYMPSLESLSFEACEGAESVICALSGANACRSPLPSPRKWLCPQLTKISLISCIELQFSCLAYTILSRKRNAEGSVRTPLETAFATRTIKPLKRKVATHTDSPASPFATPPRARAGSPAIDPFDNLASPNGSLVAGWTAHENTVPLPIETLRIVGCQKISEALALSLRSKEYGVREVSWSA